jgi:proteasome lid subunit RPN8/RPN11
VQDFRCDAEQHAADQAPLEACGVVVNGQYVPCRNIAVEPEQDFILNPVDYARAALSGKIEAIVHSHPKGGSASKADRAACQYTKLPWHIFSMPDKKWSTINLC